VGKMMGKFFRIVIVLIILVIGIYFSLSLINSGPPSPTITAGKKHIPTAQGSYCWNSLFNGRCVDMISPPEIIKHEGLKPVAISPKTKLKIEFRKEPEKNTLGANLWMRNSKTENVKINGQILTVPEEKGIYVYDIYAYWKNGSSSYAFVIEVVP
jgi:hypothetical protein